ncbi:MAG TPA: hypothetical protein PKD64_14685 [Pirellulaceae bacterium]|nr:hypothetical protein [Pirellulaceae bacterium]HMO93428.1 hypothetical protein [Pirellulaceae bacterium]HMP68464.1 hypothetical protein [Pirellulaceae bacterium]
MKLWFVLSSALVVLLTTHSAQASLIVSSLQTPVLQNFNGLGTGTNLNVLNSGAWRLGSGATPNWASGTSTLTQVQTGVLGPTAAGGSYNFRDGGNTSDRAIGFLSSGAFSSPQSIMLQISNQTGNTLTGLMLEFDYEKYRNGTRAFDMTFFHSADGINWVAATAGDQSYPADANNAGGISTPSVINKSVNISGLSIANNSFYYLRWNYAGVGGSTNGQAIGIDNFYISAVPEPTAFFLVSPLAGLLFVRRRRRSA